jgi:co-chaperonin GroES (HSP10)
MAQPIRNQIMVKAFPPDEMSAGGIIVADSFKKDSNRVTIVAVGNGTKKRPMNLKAGQIGYRVMDWGLPFEENGEKFYVMDADAIIAVE